MVYEIGISTEGGDVGCSRMKASAEKGLLSVRNRQDGNDDRSSRTLSLSPRGPGLSNLAFASSSASGR